MRGCFRFVVLLILELLGIGRHWAFLTVEHSTGLDDRVLQLATAPLRNILVADGLKYLGCEWRVAARCGKYSTILSKRFCLRKISSVTKVWDGIDEFGVTHAIMIMNHIECVWHRLWSTCVFLGLSEWSPLPCRCSQSFSDQFQMSRNQMKYESKA